MCVRSREFRSDSTDMTRMDEICREQKTFFLFLQLYPSTSSFRNRPRCAVNKNLNLACEFSTKTKILEMKQPPQSELMMTRQKRPKSKLLVSFAIIRSALRYICIMTVHLFFFCATQGLKQKKIVLDVDIAASASADQLSSKDWSLLLFSFLFFT